MTGGVSQPLQVVGVVASPQRGRTAALVEAVVSGCCQDAPAAVRTVFLSEVSPTEAAAKLAGCECVILGTPIYRATYTGLLKQFLDAVPRGVDEPHESPLRARPVAVVGTGGSAHHFLGIDPLLALLVRFFGAYVVPPGLYFDNGAFAEDGSLGEREAAEARELGRRAASLAQAVRSAVVLEAARPQV